MIQEKIKLVLFTTIETNENNDTSLNYFMKPPQSTSRTTPTNSNLGTPRNKSANNNSRQAISRPVPLFKLENEIDETELLNEKIPSNITRYFSDTIIFLFFRVYLF